MIIVMKPNAEESAVKKIITKIEEKGLRIIRKFCKI